VTANRYVPGGKPDARKEPSLAIGAPTVGPPDVDANATDLALMTAPPGKAPPTSAAPAADVRAESPASAGAAGDKPRNAAANAAAAAERRK
jgi:hypothetical protein